METLTVILGIYAIVATIVALWATREYSQATERAQRARTIGHLAIDQRDIALAQRDRAWDLVFPGWRDRT
jgi:FtsZ-interacting cell division protein ZipA